MGKPWSGYRLAAAVAPVVVSVCLRGRCGCVSGVDVPSSRTLSVP